MAEELHWFKKWDTVLKWKPPHAEWFVGGKINISYNCLDRHLTTWRRNKAALDLGRRAGRQRTLTYQQLHPEVCKFANVLKRTGVEKGDRVALYMPLIPELAIAMLACARIGATHSVIFGGFSSTALIDRINDASCKVVVTADGGWRRGSEVKLKAAVDEALKETPSVKTCIVVRRTGVADPHGSRARSLVARADGNCRTPIARPRNSTANIRSTFFTPRARPENRKGILHTTAGYLLQTHLTTKWIFDLKDEDIYWCTADIGWVTGHSYVVYGPLSNGATVLMYEGAPNYPEPDRFWDIIERHRVNIFYTAPTAIRAFIKWGEQWPLKHDLSSLRLLGTVGEPINPEAWMWYHEDDWQGAMSNCRHVVADRNRRDHDLAASRRDTDQTRFGNPTVPGNRSRRDDARRQAGRRKRRRLSGHQTSLAFDAANDLGRRRTLSRTILVAD